MCTGGLIVSFTGLVITAAGLARTWRSFSEPDEGFFDPIIHPVNRIVRRAWHVVVRLIRNAFRRRPPPQELKVGTIASAEAVGSVTAALKFRPPPEDPSEAIAELHRRTQRMQETIEKLGSDMRAGDEQQRTERQRLAQQLDDMAGNLEGLTRRVAVGAPARRHWASSSSPPAWSYKRPAEVAGPNRRISVRRPRGRWTTRGQASNDNPYSETNFQTLKYCPAFPGGFGSIEDARAFCSVFFDLRGPR